MIPSKKIKYLGIKLKKHVNDLYKKTTNYWGKRSKKSTEGGKISRAHGLINIVKMATLTQNNLHVQCNSQKILITFITEIEKFTLNFIWQHKRPWIAKAILSKKEQCWKYHNTRLQTILQSHRNKNSMVLAQKQIWRPVEQIRGPRYESTQVEPPNFWQGAKNIQWRKDSLFNKWCWEK
jgi:hypothetical protein